MTPHLKLIEHDPAKGQYGDCYRTALACLLDLEPASVPHVMGVDDNWRETMRRWLSERGYWMVEIPVIAGSLRAALKTFGALNPGTFYILCGQTASRVGHCVICEGDRVVHDPNPDCSHLASGLKGDCFFAHVIIPLSQTSNSRGFAEPLRLVAR
jgi:hypothetical protein